MTNEEKIVLCAVRFWSVSPGTPTLRRGVRTVARKAGLSSRTIEATERRLVSAGMLVTPGGKTSISIGITPLGMTMTNSFYDDVPLPPWRVRRNSDGRVVNAAQAEG